MAKASTMKAQGRRLMRARELAGFKSSRQAALECGWKESSYRAHENGTRTIGQDDAERYAARFRQAGVRVTARDILFGEEGQTAIDPMTPLTRSPSAYKRQGTPMTLEPPPANAGRRVEVEQRTAHRIPVLGRGVGGVEGRYIMNGEAIDYVPSLVGLEDVPGAYAVYVDGDSMIPKFEAGDIVYVHPSKPIRRDCYVMVQIRGEAGDPPSGYIKRFIQWTPDRLILRQLNPDKEVSFDVGQVVSVHRIVGSTEG